jgi:pantothenate kinase
MDGFHRDNEDLAAHGLLERKGAPETFDAQGFAALVTRLRSEPALSVPTFDRAADRVVPGGARIAPTDHTILVEGNYLLLDRPVWQDLAQVWDFSIFLDVPIEELKRRLIARWIGHGHSEQEALERAMGNDIPNAELVVQNARPADLVVG